MLLIEKNLEILLEHHQAFVILVFPRFASSTFVPSEHFVLKSLHSTKLSGSLMLRQGKLIWTSMKRNTRRALYAKLLFLHPIQLRAPHPDRLR